MSFPALGKVLDFQYFYFLHEHVYTTVCVLLITVSHILLCKHVMMH
jgi:hypothetical protein